ncbi:MAG: hypothetical protein MSS51_08495 [Bacteroidales bacterium]|nr:hypothetical protein [Bacteroidales bacterium]
MIGAIIGAGLTAASSIIGGLKASKAAKRAKKETEAQRQRNQNWFDRAYNEDETQRADAQRLLEMTEDNIRNRNKAAAGTQAVMGGTDESLAATKAANNQALANTASAINAKADARKDDIERSYRQMDEGYSQDLRNIENQRAQNIAAATKGAIGASGNIANSLDGAFGGTDGTDAGGQEDKKPSKE